MPVPRCRSQHETRCQGNIITCNGSSLKIMDGGKSWDNFKHIQAGCEKRNQILVNKLLTIGINLLLALSCEYVISTIIYINFYRQLQVNLIYQIMFLDKFVSFCLIKSLKPRRTLSTCTYGEVSPTFLGQNIAESNIFGSK